MPSFESTSRWTARGAIVIATLLAGLVGCKGKNNRPPPLPTVEKAKLWQASDYKRPAPVRSEQGQAITPVVIADDPVPSAAVSQPGASGQQAGGGTLNGDPGGITRESLNRSIQGAMGLLASCFTSITQDPMVAVSFEADPSGRPSLVRVNGAPPDAERCIRNVVQGIRFPSFEGKGVQVDLPLSFHRSGRPQQPVPSGEQQAQAAAPPLFIQP